MKNVVLIFLMLVTLSLISGCAVIDFLDGRHLNHEPDQYQRDQYSPQYGGGNSGGHSH